jgi:uroporphyrinogen-III synthase
MTDLAPGSWSGKCVWLTRPQFQIESLKSALETAGCDVLHLPMFDIKPLNWDQKIRDIVLNLDHYDLVFFISTNAAKLGLDCFLHHWVQLPSGQSYFAVGPTTAEVLEQEGLVVHYPTSRMSSEALLALPQLQNITGQKALVCRGVGGRETLATGLKEQGAQVDYLELYERAVPEYDNDFLRECIEAHAADAIVVSSAEALDNLVVVFGQIDLSLQDKLLLVSSERIQDKANSLGFTRVQVMTGASDPCIMDALAGLFAETGTA